ncbi:putative Ran exchange factor Prp20/Pim1 [Metarhizium anisopliae]
MIAFAKSLLLSSRDARDSRANGAHGVDNTPQTPGKRKIGDTTNEIKDTPIKKEPGSNTPTKRRKINGIPPRRTRPSKQLNNAPTQRLDISVFGSGENGELGLGNKSHNNKSPIKANRPRLNHLLNAEDVGIVQVAVGSVHCAALTHDGRVLTWGVNDSRALGRSTKCDPPVQPDKDVTDLNPLESTPAPVEGLEKLGSDITQVAVTDNATFVLTRSGLVYGWGTFFGSDGVYGFLREKMCPKKKSKYKERFQVTPIQIGGLKDIKKLSAGGNHVLALTESGDVYAWGSGQQAELGRRLVQRHQFESLIPRMVDLPRKGIVKVFAGFNHSFAIDKEGQAWTWGLNNFGQTGLAANEDNLHVGTPTVIQGLKGYKIRHMAGGFQHSLACTEDGNVLAWGRCDNSQVGIDVSALPREHVLCDSRGRPRILLQPTIIPGITATLVAAGIDNSFAITPEGKVLTWGYSENCRAGQGADTTIETPTELTEKAVSGKSFTFAACRGQFSLIASPRKS